MPEDLSARAASEFARALADQHARYAHEQPPYAVFGYAYALERLANCVTAETIAAAQALAPPGRDITRCLRAHSTVGADADHLRDLAALLAIFAGLARIAVERAIDATVPLVVAAATDDAPRARLLG
ncbi:MAG: hypothetical protein WDO24_23300 [Pseudomonadota bacterium]